MQKELQKGCANRCKSKYNLLSQSGTVSQRMIDIISYTDERIIAYCYMRQQIRTFKRTNILAMERSERRMEAFV